MCGAVLSTTPTMAVEPQAPHAPAALVDLTTAAERSVNSVVYIKVTKNGSTRTVTTYDPFSDFFDFFGFGGGGGGNNGRQQRQVQTPKKEASGSGVIISKDGYIVTNNHVVGEADEIMVTLNDNREFAATIVGCDETSDLALIKVDAKDLPAITIGNSDDLKVGQWVLAVGNPFNLKSTVTAGIISAKARTLGANSIESFIQTDAAINAGNSGGALVDEEGRLVGINAMLYSQTGNFTGYGFAIPTTIMNKVVADLREFGQVQRALLGVRGSDVSNYIDAQREKGKEVDLGTLTGIYIANVEEGSAAEDAGLQEGDVVMQFDGREVTKMAQLQEAIAQHRPGDKVTVLYMRNKKQKTASVTLKNPQGNTTVLEQIDLDVLGANLTPLSESEMTRLGIRYGLVVSAIKKGKMQAAGITKGTIILQVNDERMKTSEDFEDAVRSANNSSDRTLWIKALTPAGVKRSFVVDLAEKD